MVVNVIALPCANADAYAVALLVFDAAAALACACRLGLDAFFVARSGGRLRAFGTGVLRNAGPDRCERVFFQREARLYLVTNRHVLIDRPSGHLPDRIEIEVHTDADNLTHAAALSATDADTGEADAV